MRTEEEKAPSLMKSYPVVDAKNRLKQRYSSKHFRNYVIYVKQLESANGSHEEQAIAAVLAYLWSYSESMSEVFLEYMRTIEDRHFRR